MKLQLLLATCVALATAQRRNFPQYRVRDEGAEAASGAAVNPHQAKPANEESGFVHPIDFSGLLRGSVLGSESSGTPFIGAHYGVPQVQTFSAPQNAAPLFAAQQPTGAAFRPSQHEFGSFGAETQNVKKEEGFVQPEVHFGSFFDAGAGVFNVKDFLTAHASSQKEVEDRVNAAAEATGSRGRGVEREEEREGADEGRRRAAATEHTVYHGAEEDEEEEAEDEEHPVHSRPPPRGPPQRAAQTEERGPAQFGRKPSSDPYYGPDYSKAIEEAEEGSAAAVSKGKRCKKVAKKVTSDDVGRGRYRRANKPAMTCYVCEDPENGGSYESCAYASSPKDKSYFESRAFSSKGKGNKYRQRRYLPEQDTTASATNEQEETQEEEKHIGQADDPKMAYEAVSGDSYDENFKKLFPEFTYREASASSPSVASASALKPEEEEEEATEEDRATDYGYKGPPAAFFLDAAQKKHLEKLVGEFSQKDRTACKKVMKDKMTCFQCVDEKGIQHEECMFVAKSDPKGRHLAYHELKEYRLVPEDPPSDAFAATTSLVNPLRVPAPSAAASESKRKVAEEERRISPEEAAEADGVYADETSHAFDPVRKIHLPKYMLKKSEHEAIFEEFVKASHETED